MARTPPSGNGRDGPAVPVTLAGCRFALVLRDVGGAPGPTIHRLRSALKRLLRAYGLRCEQIRELRDQTQMTPDEGRDP
jgi:hypothetical protein